MNAWRAELLEILSRAETDRPPALRRSRREEWMYATDLPQAGGKEAVSAFCREAGARGWRWEAKAGWIELSRDAEAPPEGWFDGPFGPEAACCASLTERHGETGTGEAQRPEEDERRRWTAALIRAGEEGPQAVERACCLLHREWAVRLRKGEPIPRMDARFFGRGGRTAGASRDPEDG